MRLAGYSKCQTVYEEVLFEMYVLDVAVWQDVSFQTKETFADKYHLV